MPAFTCNNYEEACNDYERADYRIWELIEKLKADGLCECCIASALCGNAAVMYGNVMGSTAAAHAFDELAQGFLEDDLPVRESARLCETISRRQVNAPKSSGSQH